MNDIKQLTDEERHKILDRRKKARALGIDPNFKERRRAQVCLVCHQPFPPTGPNQVVCAQCSDDGLRGGARHRPRF